jgi:CBS domain containing-hemolysin-like protein
MPTETMPDPEKSDPSSSATQPPTAAPSPAPPRTRDTTDGLFSRLSRALFGARGETIREDLAEALDETGGGEAGFSPAESRMLRNILEFRDRRIVDVMVPRADIVAVQQDIVLGELLKVYENAGHSRLVVYNESLDDPVGMVHIRDVVGHMVGRAGGAETEAGLDLRKVDLTLPLSAAKITRRLLFVPPSMPAVDLLAKMQATRIHLALVIDEYGGTDGIVSIEDIVEEIVGDIEDEHDDEETPAVTRQPDGTLVVDARATLEDVVALAGPDFDVGEVAEEVDTIGGFLVTELGRVPVRGELVPGPADFEIEVLDADPRRVKKLRIRRQGDAAQPPRRKRAEGEAADTTARNTVTPAEQPVPVARDPAA